MDINHPEFVDMSVEQVVEAKRINTIIDLRFVL